LPEVTAEDVQRRLKACHRNYSKVEISKKEFPEEAAAFQVEN